MIHQLDVLDRGRIGAGTCTIRRKGCWAARLKVWAVVQVIVTLPRLCSCVGWP